MTSVPDEATSFHFYQRSASGRVRDQSCTVVLSRALPATGVLLTY
jgi:hypothetical protein